MKCVSNVSGDAVLPNSAAIFYEGTIPNDKTLSTEVQANPLHQGLVPSGWKFLIHTVTLGFSTGAAAW